MSGTKKKRVAMNKQKIHRVQSEIRARMKGQREGKEILGREDRRLGECIALIAVVYRVYIHFVMASALRERRGRRATVGNIRTYRWRENSFMTPKRLRNTS